MEEIRDPADEGLEPASEQQVPPTSKTKKKRSRPFDIIETVVVALLLAIAIRATIAEARFIPSGSMIPTLQIGDRLIVEKISYYLRDPQRGDILVFYPPHPEQPPLSASQRVMRWLGFTREAAFIKRVVGMPGDQLMIKAGQVMINGQLLAEPYTLANTEAQQGGSTSFGTGLMDDLPQQRIPPGHYFMMGDNRDNSRDSRFWGTLPRENVIGRSFVRFWPLNRLGLP